MKNTESGRAVVIPNSLYEFSHTCGMQDNEGQNQYRDDFHMTYDAPERNVPQQGPFSGGYFVALSRDGKTSSNPIRRVAVDDL